jgi:hypothetical protein
LRQLNVGASFRRVHENVPRSMLWATRLATFPAEIPRLVQHHRHHLTSIRQAGDALSLRPVRILFESRPQFRGGSGATNRPVTRQDRCVGFGVVRE